MTCLLPLITDADRKRSKLVVSYQSLSIAISRYLSKSNGCHILPKNAIEWFCRIIRSLQRTKISVFKNTVPKTRWLTLYFTIQDGVTGDILQESKKKEKSTAQIWLLIAISRTCCIGRICCKGHFPDIESVGLHFFYVKSSVKLIIRDPTCSASDVWPRRIQKISILRCLSSESLQLSFSP